MNPDSDSFGAVTWPDGTGTMQGRFFRQLEADGHVKRDGQHVVVRVVGLDPFSSKQLEGFYEVWQAGDDFIRDQWSMRRLG